MMKLSNETVKARSAPPTIPGKVNGSVTRTNVRHSPAPKSIAASSSDRSKPINRADTTVITKGNPTSACPPTTIQNPPCRFSEVDGERG